MLVPYITFGKLIININLPKGCNTVCCFEALEELNPNPQTKRRIGIANPTKYYIELYNDKATNKTKPDDFIENSKLSFFHKGTLIL